jgi:hypothetical protein
MKGNEDENYYFDFQFERVSQFRVANIIISTIFWQIIFSLRIQSAHFIELPLKVVKNSLPSSLSNRLLQKLPLISVTNEKAFIIAHTRQHSFISELNLREFFLHFHSTPPHHLHLDDATIHSICHTHRRTSQ